MQLIDRLNLALRLFFLSCLLWITLPLSAENREYVVPQNVSQVRLFLHTTGLGNELYTRGGHSAIRVLDPTQNLDRIYNWGMFDFEDPLFALNFYLGNLWYYLNDYSSAHSRRIYAIEMRKVVEDELILTENEKRIFLEKLSWNTRSENRKYLYKIFEDNCSTRIRDYLNEAFNNQLFEKTQKINVGKSFRDEVREALWGDTFIQFGLSVLLNSDVDSQMNYWNAMFLPAYLRSALIATGKIHQESTKTLQNEELKLNVYPNIPYILWFVLILPSLAAFLFFLSRKKLLEKLFTTFYLIFSFWTSSCALVMSANWIFSFHEVLHHNLGLIVYWPLDFVLVYGFLFKKNWAYRKYLIHTTLVKIILIFMMQFVLDLPQKIEMHYLFINWVMYFLLQFSMLNNPKGEKL